MKSINQQVWHALQTDPALMRDLPRKLINTRALAKYLIHTRNLPASLDAVISSIRRFPLDDFKKEEQQLSNVFHNAVISTKTNIACVTISQTPQAALKKLNDVPVLRITTGTDEVKLIVDNKHAKSVGKHFGKPGIEANLSEICVTLPEQAVKTKGVLAKITAELAVANINIHELFVCPPQFLIYVRAQDLVKAHERIMMLTT